MYPFKICISTHIYIIEPFDVLLDEQVDGVQEQVQSLLENIIYQRRSAIGQLEPLAKEVVSHQASVDKTFFDNNTNNNDDNENNEEEQGIHTYTDKLLLFRLAHAKKKKEICIDIYWNHYRTRSDKGGS